MDAGKARNAKFIQSLYTSNNKMNTIFPLQKAIGVFDSGVGGLSVLREIRNTIPHAPIIFFGDQYHVPYGPRSLNEVLSFSRIITRFLINLGAEMIVVACNAASAAALIELRKEFPAIPFVGMEPAVKPAAEKTLTGTVGVLATPATFQGKLYASVIERFANGVKIVQDTCPGLVQQIEKADFNSEATVNILKKAIEPMINAGIDKVVLGCTHYPFVIPAIQQIVGPKIQVIDPAPAIARQTAKIYEQIQQNPVVIDHTLNTPTFIITSGDTSKLAEIIAKFIPFSVKLIEAEWDKNNYNLNLTHTNQT
jgi:glutamate racemase